MQTLKYGLLLLLMSIYSIGWGIEVPLRGVDTCQVLLGDTMVVTESGITGTCDGTLVVESGNGDVIYIEGSLSLNRGNEYVEIYDGVGPNACFVGRYGGIENIPKLRCYSGIASIYFYSDDKTLDDEFDLLVWTCPRSSKVFNLQSVVYNEDYSMITWEDTSGTTAWHVISGSNAQSTYREEVVTSPRVLLLSDNCLAEYNCRIFDANDSLDCGSELYFFKGYQGKSVCENFLDLTSCKVVGTYGIYNDPYQAVGILDYGSDERTSRHTVHTDTTEWAPWTGNRLRTVPPGEIASVRLGNDCGGAEAESLTYLYRVDTSINDLLIMKYAAVLQDPNHEAKYQPKFQFKVLNEFDEEVNSVCYSREYVADTSLGWHRVFLTLWKDWTTVGIPLDELHGQIIKLRFVTYDCAHGAHIGFAYFNLKCGNKIIRTESCGESIANTFTAPDGFKYRWYNINDMNTVLGTKQSLSVTEAGTYKCILTMLDVPEGSCEIELLATATTRYPYAQFVSERVGDDCDRMISFSERSAVATNVEHTVLLDESCEDIFWDFGDGEVSSERNPIHQYAQRGTYEVTMVASMAGGACTDTVHQMVEVGMSCNTEVIIDTICSDSVYVFFDSVITSSGLYSHETDTLTTLLRLEVIPNIFYYFDTIVEDQLPYRYREYLFDTIIEDSVLVYPSSNRCDSLIHFNLMVYYDVAVHVDQVVCDNALPYVSAGESYDSAGIYTQFLQTCHGTDSVVTLNLMIKPSYNLQVVDTICGNEIYISGHHEYSQTGIYYDSLVSRYGCDSVVTLDLLVKDSPYIIDSVKLCKGETVTWQDGNIYDSATTEPKVIFEAINGCDSVVQLCLEVSRLDAQSRVSPIYVTSENSEVKLSDISVGGDSRIWYLPNMTSEEEQWRYNYPLIEDSINVRLVVTDKLGCEDTIEVWVYNIEPEIWIPNVFTPGKETNNIFRAMHKDLLDIEMRIFTRRGQFIYKYTTLDGGWDGTFKGKNCPQGAYVYKAIYHTKIKPEEDKIAVGTVVLLR